MKKRPIGILPITPEMEINEYARDVSKHYISKAVYKSKADYITMQYEIKTHGSECTAKESRACNYCET